MPRSRRHWPALRTTAAARGGGVVDDPVVLGEEAAEDVPDPFFGLGGEVDLDGRPPPVGGEHTVGKMGPPPPDAVPEFPLADPRHGPVPGLDGRADPGHGVAVGQGGQRRFGGPVAEPGHRQAGAGGPDGGYLADEEPAAVGQLEVPPAAQGAVDHGVGDPPRRPGRPVL